MRVALSARVARRAVRAGARRSPTDAACCVARGKAPVGLRTELFCETGVRVTTERERESSRTRARALVKGGSFQTSLFDGGATQRVFQKKVARRENSRASEGRGRVRRSSRRRYPRAQRVRRRPECVTHTRWGARRRALVSFKRRRGFAISQISGRGFESLRKTSAWSLVRGPRDGT